MIASGEQPAEQSRVDAGVIESCWVAGVDEVGRGPLAGPVVAAAVILPAQFELRGLRDSKKLSARTRARLESEIRTCAVAYAIGEASVEEIDRLNILHATMLAMQRAVAGLAVQPQQVLVDGNRAPAFAMPARAIVGGDDCVPAISAASVLAKEHRDRFMRELDADFPEYGFAGHKGYGSATHIEVLMRLGPTPWHRRSFAPVRLAGGEPRVAAPVRAPARGTRRRPSAVNVSQLGLALDTPASTLAHAPEPLS